MLSCEASRSLFCTCPDKSLRVTLHQKVRGIIRNFASEEDNIIILGCGNSRMCEDMAADGYLHLMNIDFSRVVVEQARIVRLAIIRFI
jgi:2-polyprenyl-3-methyl-5-hydroxy-6-metoxy-1,4-benzoquinol methylase